MVSTDICGEDGGSRPLQRLLHRPQAWFRLPARPCSPRPLRFVRKISRERNASCQLLAGRLFMVPDTAVTANVYTFLYTHQVVHPKDTFKQPQSWLACATGGTIGLVPTWRSVAILVAQSLAVAWGRCRLKFPTCIGWCGGHYRTRV